MSERLGPKPFEIDPVATEIELVPEPEAGSNPLVEVDQPPPAPPISKWRRRLLAATGLGVLGGLVIQSIDYVQGLLVTDPLLGWPMAALTAVVVVSGLTWSGIEIRDLRRLQRRAALRREADRLAGSELHGQAEPLLREIGAQLPASSAAASFETIASDALDDGERLLLYERRVLAPVDRAAYRLVLEASRDIGVLTALAPTGLLDGVLVLWRTTTMLRQIARLYGIAPGPIATARLLRHAFRNAALAGLADIIAHAAVEHVGASLIAMLSARAGQGAGNALLASRLGLSAIAECRPLPFMGEPPPRLAEIRKALLDTPPDKPIRLERR